MTNLEAIQANISSAHGVVLEQNHFVKALNDVDLTHTDSYDSEKKIDLATIKLYDIILGGANLSEGHLSYSFTEGVEKAKLALQNKLGIQDFQNKITSPKVW